MIAPEPGTKTDPNFRLPKQTTTVYWVDSDISGADKSIARTPGTSSKLGRASTISSSTSGRTSKRKFQKFGEIYSHVYKRTAAPIFAYVIVMIFSPLASQFANSNPPVNPAAFVY